jgi:hypothetical protein
VVAWAAMRGFMEVSVDMEQTELAF